MSRKLALCYNVQKIVSNVAEATASYCTVYGFFKHVIKLIVHLNNNSSVLATELLLKTEHIALMFWLVWHIGS